MFWRELLQLSEHRYIIDMKISLEQILSTSVAQFQWVCLLLTCKLLTDLIFNLLHPFLIECHDDWSGIIMFECVIVHDK